MDADKDEDGNIVGYYIIDAFGSCPIVYDGWDYMDVIFKDSYEDKEWPFESYTGPDGKEWKFYTEEVLFAQPEEEDEPVYYDDDFYLGFYGATPFEYNHDKSELYSFLETYDR